MSDPSGYAPRDGVLEEQTWPAMRDGEWPVALLPFGATEPHNTHLPYGTDTIMGREVAARVAAACAAPAGALVARRGGGEAPRGELGGSTAADACAPPAA